jgi:dihydroceramidase
MAESVTSGFWGEPTSTIDWCENNYEVTYYIAEFWNTVSNLVMIVLPLYGIYWSIKQKDSKKFNSFRVTNSMLLCHLGLCLVGLGSWMFHMTLLYPMQLLDELPMVFGSGILIYAHYDLFLSAYLIEQQSRRSSRVSKRKSLLYKIFISRPYIASAIFAYCASFTYIYVYVWKNPIFHEIAYGIQVFTIILFSILNIKYYKTKKSLWAMSLLYYGIGFFLWNLDNKYVPILIDT